jgi:formamidopyrimidine-DNA glycosylase
MPELPEVETVARGLKSVLEGRTIVALEQNRADLRIPFPDDLANRVIGRRVIAIDRRAKYLRLALDDGAVLVVHLGMSGRFVVRAPGSNASSPHDHLVLTADDGVRYVLNDPRRFGLVALTTVAEAGKHALFAHLGPEPLGEAFVAGALTAALRGKKSPIKTALLDQRIVAGLGNIYVCEALYRARISPLRLAGTLSRKEIGRLVGAVRQVLVEAIEAGGSTLRDFVNHEGEFGYFQHRFAVYAREGKRCADCDCDIGKTGGVARLTQSGRSTFYCARRQR